MGRFCLSPEKAHGKYYSESGHAQTLRNLSGSAEADIVTGIAKGHDDVENGELGVTRKSTGVGNVLKLSSFSDDGSPLSLFFEIKLGLATLQYNC